MMKRILGIYIASVILAAVSITMGCGYDVDIDYPPVIELIQPENGETFQLGDSIVFRCSAGDPGHGELVGELIRWESDIDQEIGTGNLFSRKDLSLGTHNITITATDSMNNWSTLDFSIVIE